MAEDQRRTLTFRTKRILALKRSLVVTLTPELTAMGLKAGDYVYVELQLGRIVIGGADIVDPAAQVPNSAQLRSEK